MTEDDQEMQIQSDSHAVSSRRSRLRWYNSLDLEARMAYGRTLMSGHGMLHFLLCSKPYTLKPSRLDREYDPALFEDAIPINDDRACLFYHFRLVAHSYLI
jgi:hypothetical protein